MALQCITRQSSRDTCFATPVALPSPALPLQFGCFWTNGQICSATSRLLVQQDIAEKFLAHLKRRAESIQVNDPLVKGARLGPIVSHSGRDVCDTCPPWRWPVTCVP
jgi:hypothetical protein